MKATIAQSRSMAYCELRQNEEGLWGWVTFWGYGPLATSWAAPAWYDGYYRAASEFVEFYTENGKLTRLIVDNVCELGAFCPVHGPRHAAQNEYTFGCEDARLTKYRCGCCVVENVDKGPAEWFDNYPAAEGYARLIKAGNDVTERALR